MTEQTHHDESQLSAKQISWKKDALELAKGLIGKYTETDLDYCFDPQLLDSAFENAMKQSWWKRPKKFILITVRLNFRYNTI